jgi:predicted nucleic acid-binding protein
MNASPGMIYFLDTNILVYAYDLSAGEKHHLAGQLVEQCWENGNGCLSIQVLQEFYVSVTQKIARPLDHLTAWKIVSNLTRWRLHVPDGNDLLQAIDLQQSCRISFWDALVVHSAARLGCKQLFSEDLSHGEIYGEVQVINPFYSLKKP